jgi:peroxiredoxin
MLTTKTLRPYMTRLVPSKTSMPWRKKSLVVALALLMSVGASHSRAATRIVDFALLDQHGDLFQLSYFKDAKAVVVVVFPQSEDKKLISDYQAVAGKYRSQEFIFAAIRIGAVENRAALKKRLSDAGVRIPVLLDDSESIAELLSLRRAGEVLLLDPARQQVLFRGPIGPALILAIKQRQADETIAPALVAVPGADMPLSSARKDWRDPKATSYVSDVAPILTKNCLGCHRVGGIAPFAMDSWSVVSGWSPMIKEVLLNKRMPPGQVDPTIGNFKNGRALKAPELATIVRWIDAGTPKDGEGDPLAKVVEHNDQWAFGEPDHIIELPPQTVPAIGPLDFSTVVLATGLDQSKWIRASQFMPGDKRVLHHAELFISPPSAETPSAESTQPSASSLPPYYGGVNPDVATFSPFAPGDAPLAMPGNTGGLIAKDASVVAQLHYGVIGREVEDKSRLGLWFYDDAAPPKERMATACICLAPAQWKNIPPRTANVTAQATLTLEKNGYLYSVLPRMHYRGSAIRLDAKLPSGEVEPLLNVAKYNYNWQVNYQFVVPKFIPAGTKIIASARYDNSSRNSLNPDPSQEVRWGRQSFDEELSAVFQLKYVD